MSNNNGSGGNDDDGWKLCRKDVCVTLPINDSGAVKLAAAGLGAWILYRLFRGR